MSPNEQVRFRYAIAVFLESCIQDPGSDNVERNMQALEKWVDSYTNRELALYVGKGAKLTVKEG
jgi:hypothetical protein